MHSALKSKNRHLDEVAEDDIPQNTLKIWAGSLNLLYVILSSPAQMSGILKIHRDEGTVNGLAMFDLNRGLCPLTSSFLKPVKYISNYMRSVLCINNKFMSLSNVYVGLFTLGSFFLSQPLSNFLYLSLSIFLSPPTSVCLSPPMSS